MSIRSVGSSSDFFLPDENGGSQQVLQVQRALNQLGGEQVLPEDGIFTPETQQAVEEFQKQHQLPATGTIDDRTVDTMQVALRKTAGGDAAAAPATQSTGKQDLSLTGVLMQSKLGASPPAPPAPQRPFLESFQSTLGELLPTLSSQEGVQQIAGRLATFETTQNPYFSLGCGIGKDWSAAAMQQTIQQFQSTQMLNPDALDFCNLIESVQGDSQKLSAQNCLPFAQLSASYAETMLGMVTPRIPDALQVSAGRFTTDVQISGIDFMKQSGNQLAVCMAGVASGSLPLDAAAVIQGMTGAAIAAAAAATGFAPSEGSLMPLVAGAMLNLTQQLPELLRRCGVDVSLDANPVAYLTLNLAVTSIVTAVIMATQQQTIVKTDRQIASVVHSNVQSEVEIGGILVNDALQQVLNHQEVTTRKVLAASIQAMAAAEAGNTDQAALVSAGTGNIQDIAFTIRNSAVKILDTTGKIVESSRMLRLLTER